MNYRTVLLCALCFHPTVTSAMNEMERKERKIEAKQDAYPERSWLFKGKSKGQAPLTAPRLLYKSTPFIDKASGHNSPLLCAAIHPDNNHLAFSLEENGDRSPYFLRVGQNGQEYDYCHIRHAGPKALVTSMAFSPQGTMLALAKQIALATSQITLCTHVDVSNEVPAWTCAHDNPFAQVPSFFRALQFNEDCSTLATASHDGAVRLWDIEKSSCTRVVQEKNVAPVYAVTYLDTNFFCFSNAHNGVSLCDPRYPRVLPLADLHGEAVRALSINVAKNLIVSGAYDGSIRFGDLRLINRMISIKKCAPSPVTALAIHQHYPECIAGHHNGVVTVFNDKFASLHLYTLLDHQGPVTAVALTGDRNYTALSLGNDGWLHRISKPKRKAKSKKEDVAAA